jgi:hypothetical protein
VSWSKPCECGELAGGLDKRWRHHTIHLSFSASVLLNTDHPGRADRTCRKNVSANSNSVTYDKGPLKTGMPISISLRPIRNFCTDETFYSKEAAVYLTWEARSRVGRTTSALSLRTMRADSPWQMGSAYEKVFPLPVGAHTHRSWSSDPLAT